MIIVHLIEWYANLKNKCWHQDDYCVECHHIIEDRQCLVRLGKAKRKMVSHDGRVWWHVVDGATVCNEECLDRALKMGDLQIDEN